MVARLNRINAEIADVERLISSKNLTIISALKKEQIRSTRKTRLSF